MIKEDYVSYDIAKLLKEKGFKGQGEHFYEDNKITNYTNYWFNATPTQRYEAIEAPTLQMVMKWLREAHNIDITITPDRKEGYTAMIFVNMELPFTEIGSFKTYESACEASIEYCLKNLI